MKKIIFIVSIVSLLGLFSCEEEVPIEPSANFTTNIKNNTLETGENFVVYLDNVDGEFATYFRGEGESVFIPDDVPAGGLINGLFGAGESVNSEAPLTLYGTPIEDVSLDSIVVNGYREVGVYTFTLWTGTYYNGGEDVEEDIKSIDITVVEASE
jgi:hypothetical protein